MGSPTANDAKSGPRTDRSPNLRFESRFRISVPIHRSLRVLPARSRCFGGARRRIKPEPTTNPTTASFPRRTSKARITTTTAGAKEGGKGRSRNLLTAAEQDCLSQQFSLSFWSGSRTRERARELEWRLCARACAARAKPMNALADSLAPPSRDRPAPVQAPTNRVLGPADRQQSSTFSRLLRRRLVGADADATGCRRCRSIRQLANLHPKLQAAA